MLPPNENWVCDRIVEEFWKGTQHVRAVDYADAECVWHYAKWMAHRQPNIARDQPGHRPTITTVHHIVPGKPFDVSALDVFTDVYHVPNAITRGQLTQLTERRIEVLPYWCRLDVPDAACFVPDTTLNGLFVFGSLQRDTEGASIMGIPQPKLEKGPDLLAGVIKRFRPSECAVFFGGWRRQYLEQQLRGYSDPGWSKAGDQVTFSEEGVMNAYATLSQLGAYYLITSRFEGGPQAVLEAGATRLRVLSTRVGMAPDVLHPSCIVCDPDDPDLAVKFEAAIRRDRETGWMEETLDYNYRSVMDYAYHVVQPRYDRLISEVHDAHLRQP